MTNRTPQELLDVVLKELNSIQLNNLKKIVESIERRDEAAALIEQRGQDDKSDAKYRAELVVNNHSNYCIEYCHRIIEYDKMIQGVKNIVLPLET